jgi:hypothetical protein
MAIQNTDNNTVTSGPSRKALMIVGAVILLGIIAYMVSAANRNDMQSNAGGNVAGSSQNAGTGSTATRGTGTAAP